MLPSHRNLPLPYHLFDLAGRQAERLGVQVADLDLERLIKAAQKRTGLADFGHSYYQMGLKKLLESLEEDANLRFYGRLVMCLMLNNALSQRLLFVDAQKNHPEIFKPLSKRPIVITGLHRSGTTFLHRLLSLDSANAGIPFWRLYRPFRSPGLLDLRLFKAWAELNVLKPIFPGLKYKHCIRPFAPEESCWMLALTFYSMVYWIMAPVTAYSGWLWEQDFSEVYKEYALLLQAQQSVVPGRRLVLKAPDHMPHLDLLLASLPGAQIVQLHRDPATCVLSLSSLFYSTHIALAETLQPQSLIKANRDLAALFLQVNRRSRNNPEVDQGVFDVCFEDLAADPIATVQKVYAHFGLRPGEGFVRRLEQFLIHDKRENRPGHHYKAEQFGLVEADLKAFFIDV